MSEVNANGSNEAEGALLIGDGNPVWLRNVFTTLAGSKDARERGLLAALCIIMYESGFYFHDGPYNGTGGYDVRVMRILDDPTVILDHIKKDKSKYYTAFSNDLIYPKVLKVASYTMSANDTWKDPMLVVNFLLNNKYEIKTFLFPFKKYITIDSKDNEKIVLKGNSEFSVTLKNYFYCFNCRVTEEGYHPNHIFSLPLHVLQHLCYYLDRRSFVKFITTSKFLYETFCEDESLWEHYSLIDFRGLNKVEHETWRDHYKYQALNSNLPRPPYFNMLSFSKWYS